LAAVATIAPFRFLHTGDLHLDSPFAGITADAPPDVARVLRDATLTAWERIVALALAEGVDFVVVAGDVFEQANRTLLAQVRFRDGLARLAAAGVASFVVTGNHDPLSGWEPAVAWPEAAFRFGADDVTGVPARRDGEEIARVYGMSYAVRDVRENLARRFRRDADAPFAIGLLHANVGSQPGHLPYAPCNLADLRASGMDYWALGHIHRPAVLSGANPTVVYCGNPQGRDPGEPEPRGCYVVSVDRAGRADPVFHATDVVRWRLLDVPIDEVPGEEALVESVATAADSARADAGRSVVVRLTLTGRGPLHASLRRSGVLDEVRQLAQERLGTGAEFAWIESLRDGTRPTIDPAGLGAPGTFLGELLTEGAAARASLVGPATGGEGADAADALAWEEVLDEVYGHQRVRRVLAGRRPDARRVVELLAEAEQVVVDRLAAEE
jgi:exonuclease SbcD